MLWRAAEHHVLQNVRDAVLTGLLVQGTNLVNHAGMDRRGAMIFDDNNVHAIVERKPAGLLIQRERRRSDKRCKGA